MIDDRAVLEYIVEQARPLQPMDWEAFRYSKYVRWRDAAVQAGIVFEGSELVASYIERTCERMRGRPIRLQHDDFHPGNIIVNDGNYGGVVDFHRVDAGDPWHDYFKVPWFAEPISPAFCRGQVAGYFADGIPDEFWVLYNLYIAMSFTTTLEWTLRTLPEELDDRLAQAREIVRSHDFVHGGPPRWFERTS